MAHLLIYGNRGGGTGYSVIQSNESAKKILKNRKIIEILTQIKLSQNKSAYIFLDDVSGSKTEENKLSAIGKITYAIIEGRGSILFHYYLFDREERERLLTSSDIIFKNREFVTDIESAKDYPPSDAVTEPEDYFTGSRKDPLSVFDISGENLKVIIKGLFKSFSLNKPVYFLIDEKKAPEDTANLIKIFYKHLPTHIIRRLGFITYQDSLRQTAGSMVTNIRLRFVADNDANRFDAKNNDRSYYNLSTGETNLEKINPEEGPFFENIVLNEKNAREFYSISMEKFNSTDKANLEQYLILSEIRQLNTAYTEKLLGCGNIHDNEKLRVLKNAELKQEDRDRLISEKVNLYELINPFVKEWLDNSMISHDVYKKFILNNYNLTDNHNRVYELYEQYVRDDKDTAEFNQLQAELEPKLFDNFIGVGINSETARKIVLSYIKHKPISDFDTLLRVIDRLPELNQDYSVFFKDYIKNLNFDELPEKIKKIRGLKRNRETTEDICLSASVEAYQEKLENLNNKGKIEHLDMINGLITLSKRYTEVKKQIIESFLGKYSADYFHDILHYLKKCKTETGVIEKINLKTLRDNDIAFLKRWNINDLILINFDHSIDWIVEYKKIKDMGQADTENYLKENHIPSRHETRVLLMKNIKNYRIALPEKYKETLRNSYNYSGNEIRRAFMPAGERCLFPFLKESSDADYLSFHLPVITVKKRNIIISLAALVLAVFLIIMPATLLNNPVFPFLGKYTVTFESNGGEPVDPQTVKNIDAEPATSKEHYKFGGWIIQNGASSGNVTFPYKVKSDITFYAQWIPVKYTVRFDNVSPVIEPVTEFYNANISLPPAAKDGYTFDGWFEDGNGYTEGENYKITGNVTLSAKWTPNLYTANFNFGYNKIQPVTASYGSKITLPKLNYFKWHIKFDEADDSYTITDNVTFIAK
ncbi:MAG: InlB B-repeat-containing protein [Deferribacteraceae bacterium]|jgi:uncharacterized repeat protein (TIGR02543 family)|nr:InlB B-repeat-containing protein [Deferribacteraceae bacterium]